MPNYKTVLGVGNPGLYQSYSWNKSSGQTITYRQKFTGSNAGTAGDAYTSAITAYNASKVTGLYDTINLEATDDGATWTLTATAGGGGSQTTETELGTPAIDTEALTETIEQIPQDVSQNSLLSPVLQSKLSEKITTAVLRAIKDYESNVDGFQDPKEARDMLDYWIGRIYDDLCGNDAIKINDTFEFFEDRMAGRDSFLYVFGVTFRRTIAAPSHWFVPIDYSYIGYLYTTDEVRTECNIPVAYYMPDDGYWLKKQPSNSVQYSGKQNWVQEYVFASAPGTLYYPYKTPLT